MNPHFHYKTVSEALPIIAQDLVRYGDEVGSRNGRVKEYLNAKIVITNPTQRYVLTHGRKASVFAQIAETLWVLSGRNDVEWLSAYLPRAKDYSDDGEVWRGGYGPRIRSFGGWPHQNSDGRVGIDQVAHVVDLLRDDPLSRRAVIGIYDPRVDTAPGKDIPCNDFLQFQSRNGRLHLTVTVRSNDLMWGWSGINAFEWSTLQEMVASLLGIQVGDLTFNIGSLHLYDQHWNKAERLEYHPDIAPSVRFNPGGDIRTVEDLDRLFLQFFEWEALCRKGEPSIDMLNWIPDPLLNSWAVAIAYFWTRDERWLSLIEGTALAVAIARSPALKPSEPAQTSPGPVVGAATGAPANEATRAFYEFVKDLHAKKHASYGDSWKKRGEKTSILANIARKVDRLGVGDEYDSSADTVIDLLVYLIKYECWVNNLDADPYNVNVRLEQMLYDTGKVSTYGQALDITFTDIRSEFDYYVDHLDNLLVESKKVFITEMMRTVAPIARDLWLGEQPGDDYLGADVD
jgi:thymidylate synthase